MADSDSRSSSSRSAGAPASGRQRRVAGLFLLLFALAALADRYLDVDTGQLVPLLIGLAFLGWSLLVKEWGLLVPGGILTGIGTGLVVERANDWQAVSDHGWFLVCFAGGWLLISVLSAIFFRRRVWWPLIPAAVLGSLGGAQLLALDLRHVLALVREWWPFPAVALALYLIFWRPQR